MAAAPKKTMISMSGLDLSFMQDRKPAPRAKRATAKVISFKAESDKRRRSKAKAAVSRTSKAPPKRRA